MPTVKIALGKCQPKQHEFMMAHARYVAFGGARGGGKSWAVREKAKRLAIKWAGIKILIVRKTYVDLKENHITPLRQEIPEDVAKWREIDREFVFFNGSRIKCSYFANDNDAMNFQGQEYDIIFLEEATQFLEIVFNTLKACIRGANNFPKRMYLTCNPDGPGFSWVKRLFVSRDYRDDENPNDYMFIQSLVDDNKILMEKDPEYVKQLDSLPEEMKKRWRYGSWDVAEGQMFDDFDRRIHVIEPVLLDPHWRRYISIDYGLDRLAAYWYAVTNDNHVYVYKEFCESNLTISVAAERILEYTGDDDIYAVLAPPDLWNRSQETGRSKALIFSENGLQLSKSNNDREAGWLAIKEMLRPNAEGIPQIQIFKNCKELIRCITDIQRDPKRPNDVANEPHEFTHAPDSLRYFCIYWVHPNDEQKTRYVVYPDDILEDYYNGTDEIRAKIINRMGGYPA